MAKDTFSSFGKLFEKIFKNRYDNIKFSVNIDNLKTVNDSGIIVYSMVGAGLLDIWVLNYYLKKNGLPEAKFASNIPLICYTPIVRTFNNITGWFYTAITKRTLFSSLGKSVRNNLKKDKSFIINIKESERTKVFQRPLSERVFKLIAHFSRNSEKNIFICPIKVFWIRRSKTKSRRFFDWLFGTAESPSWFHKIVTLIRKYKASVIRSGDIINTKEFIIKKKHKTTIQLAKSLRRKVLVALSTERKITTGPVKESLNVISNYILSDKDTLKTINTLALEEDVPKRKLYKRAGKYIKEIAADFHFSYIEVMSKLLKWVLDHIYEKIIFSEEDAEIIRKASKEGTVILAPSHKSYMDFLIFSYLFYLHDFAPPHIISGINLSFWPFGKILKRCGAVFMRRTFKSNQLYSAVFKKYLQFLIKNKYHIEFFIEGTRSRTGKLLQPKYGILSMVYDAYEKGIFDDLTILPVSISFDQIVDVKSYQSEHDGKEKEQESAGGLLRSKRVLKDRFGKAYVKVGNPIKFSEEMKQVLNSTPDDDNQIKREFVQQTAYHICNELNQNTILTPTSLACFIVLVLSKKAVLHDVFHSSVKDVHKYLVSKDIYTTDDMKQNFNNTVNEALKQLEKNKVLSIMDDVFIVEEKKRTIANYYKNNMLYFVLHRSITLIALKVIAYKDLITYNDFWYWVDFIKNLLSKEFLFDKEEIFKEKIETEVSMLNVALVEHLDTVVANQPDRQDLLSKLKQPGSKAIVNALTNFFESYYIAFKCVKLYLKEEEIDEKVFLSTCHDNGYKMYLTEEVFYFESLSSIVFRNALQYLGDRNILSIKTKKEKHINKPGKTGIISPTSNLKEVNDLVGNLKTIIDILHTKL